MNGDLIKLPEPTLRFGYDQEMEDPKDGLMLFGPLDEGRPYGIRCGVIGTRDGIGRFVRWLERIQGPVFDKPPHPARPPFPGFEAVFRIPWNPKPMLEIEVSQDELNQVLHLDDKHQRVFKAVDIYSAPIIDATRQEESDVDVWFVIIPDNVYKYCRPRSRVESELQIEAQSRMRLSRALMLRQQGSFFPEDTAAAIPYHYDVDFHNQLKARLLPYTTPTQVIKESTVAHHDFRDNFNRPKRDLDPLQSDIAWSISTTAFYKAGGRPWKIGRIRDGVCYVGLVFKRDDKNPNPRSACCAAQMFLDSGDGVVFKGAVGPWYTPGRGDFHLSRRAASNLVSLALESYEQKKGHPPKELFLHGKVRFEDEEWKGFQDPLGGVTSLVGVRIRDYGDIKLYRMATHPVLRGLAYIRDERTAYLWTKGFIPRLQTYPGREVPKPLLVDVCRGVADIEIVLADIMALTKLNYNACVFGDGAPVTLKFADAVGEILTAGPLESVSPLPFKHYI